MLNNKYLATILNPATKEQIEHRFPTEKSIDCFIEMMLKDWNTFLMVIDVQYIGN